MNSGTGFLAANPIASSRPCPTQGDAQVHRHGPRPGAAGGAGTVAVLGVEVSGLHHGKEAAIPVPTCALLPPPSRSASYIPATGNDATVASAAFSLPTFQSPAPAGSASYSWSRATGTLRNVMAGSSTSGAFSGSSRTLVGAGSSSGPAAQPGATSVGATPAQMAAAAAANRTGQTLGFVSLSGGAPIPVVAMGPAGDSSTGARGPASPELPVSRHPTAGPEPAPQGLAELLEMGFGEEESRRALQATGGDVAAAVELLGSRGGV